MEKTVISKIFKEINAFVDLMAQPNYFATDRDAKISNTNKYLARLHNEVDIYDYLVKLQYDYSNNQAEFWEFCDSLAGSFYSIKEKIDGARYFLSDYGGLDVELDNNGNMYDCTKKNEDANDELLELNEIFINNMERIIEDNLRPNYMKFVRQHKNTTQTNTNPETSNANKTYAELDSLIADFNEQWGDLYFVLDVHKTFENIIKGDKWGIWGTPEELADKLDEALIDASINQSGLKNLVHSKIEVKKIKEYIDTIDRTIDIRCIAVCSIESGGKEYDNNYKSYQTYFALTKLYDAICRIDALITTTVAPTERREAQQIDNEFTALLIGDADKTKIMSVITPIMKAGGQTKIAIILMALCKLRYINLPERDKEDIIFQPIFSSFEITKNFKTFANGINQKLGHPDKYFYNEAYKKQIERMIDMLK